MAAAELQESRAISADTSIFTEFAYTNGSFGLPTMTCFMPNLPPGTPFNISLHSWKTPDISQFTRNYSKHPEVVKFEARVLVDGRLVAYATHVSLMEDVGSSS